MTQINLRIPDELLAEVEAALTPGTSRNRWIAQAIEMRLRNKTETKRHISQPGPNVEHIRSSGQVKRGVGPVPKASKK